MKQPEPTQLPEEVRQDIFRSLRGTGKQMDLRTTGTSMAPLIRAGMCVPVEFVSAEQIGHGDVILFERHGHMILHRVIGTDSATGSWIEKGDHQPFAGTVRRDEVWGRVVPSGSRFVSRIITALSRMEWGLYRLKLHLVGERTLPLGRVLAAAGAGLRRLLSQLFG